MADSKPINWAYPFKSKAAAEGETSPGSVTAESYYDALAKAKDGFYPMGANGLWHGGIHFDDGTAGSLDQSAIHCIADGEVIAYRIDQRYPTTQYGEGPTVVPLPFSTGFVLVKHRLELPSVPAPSAPAEDASETEEAAPAATTPTAAPASSALTFYSLYMHLADWASYSNADAPTPPAFFGETLYRVKTDKASDGVLGLRVRAAPKDGAVTALLPKGTKVKVGDPDAGSPAWRKLLSILEGSAIPALTGAELGWVYTGEMQAVTGEADTFLVADEANDAEPTLAPQPGLNIRKAANSGSTITGLLPVGAKCSLKAGTAAYRELQQIVEGQDIAPLSANSVHNIQGFVHFASLQASQAVPTLDSVHLLPQPYPIKAGELVGHLGKYQNFDDARPRTMLHLEVFTSEDVPAFLAQSRAIGEKLPAEQKTLIKVDKGSKIIQPAAADGQIETGADVRICSDSPKAGRWAKVRKYAICNADKNTELGRFNNTNSTYSLSTTQKATLAARMGIDVADMPDQVDFLKVYFNSVEGGDAHDYDTGTIPTTHPWRKVGAAVGEPVWVERSNLNAQGQRTSTAGALAAWNEFPLHTRIEGQACGYERILPAGSWDGLPNERKAIDPDKVQWWYVTVGDVNGNDISGWAPEKDLIVSRHSPWEWPGFSTIQDKLPLDAHLARTLDATGRATQEETQSYAALIEEAERGEILSKLYDAIDLPDEKGTRDKKLTPAELKAALGKPWLAQQLSLLISQHESEWFWNEGKWNQLDKLMDHTPADPNQNWVAEKKRIEALSWWKELAGQPGIAADGVAWHFQPVGVIGTFSQGKVRRKRDFNLGSLSSAYETGGRGSITVSGGTGDAGGPSYGSYQMTSQVKLQNGTIVVGGTVKKFINWSKFPWTDEFDGLIPGSAEFTQKWKDLVIANPEEFEDVEHEFIKITHFDIQIEKVLSETGIDLRYHSHTINDVVWSTAVQQGPGASIIVNSIKHMGLPHQENKIYDSSLIDSIYNERGKKIVGGDKDGQLYYFSKNSISVQEGVAARFISEKSKAQDLLKNESDY